MGEIVKPEQFSLAAEGAAECLRCIPEAELPPKKYLVIQAWNNAIAKLTASENVRKKGCPKSAFLALCEVSYGAPLGTYVTQDRNSDGARDALRILRANPSFIDKPRDLWKQIRGAQSYDYQMHVLVTLYRMGFVR